MEDMSEEEAIEYYYFNVVGSYVGEKTPMFVEDELFFQRKLSPLRKGVISSLTGTAIILFQ